MGERESFQDGREQGWRDKQAEIERLLALLENILSANDEFRKSLPDNWDGDPVDDACKEARAALRQKEG